MPTAGSSPAADGGVTAPDAPGFGPATRLELPSTRIGTLQLGIDDRGNWMSAWDQRTADDEVQTWARRLDASRGWEEATTLGDVGTSFVAFASDAAGRAVVLLATSVASSSSVTRRLCPPLLARAYVDGAWGPARSLGFARIGSGLMAMNEVGKTAVVWVDLLDEPNKLGWTEHLVRFDPAAGWADPLDLQSVSASNGDPQTALDEAVAWPFGEAAAVGPTGDAILAWSTAGQDWVKARALGRTGSGGGTRQLESVSPPRSSDTMRAHLSLPRVAIDGAGRSIAVWAHSDGSHSNVRTNRSIDGSSWGTTAFLETNDGGDALDPELAMDAEGNAIAIWAQSDGINNALWFNRFQIDRGWGTAERVESANPASNPGSPAIALDATSNAIAAWTDAGKIRASRYLPGSGWTAARELSTGTGQYAQPQVVLAKNGRGVVLWGEPVGDGERNFWYARIE